MLVVQPSVNLHSPLFRPFGDGPIKRFINQRLTTNPLCVSPQKKRTKSVSRLGTYLYSSKNQSHSGLASINSWFRADFRVVVFIRRALRFALKPHFLFFFLLSSKAAVGWQSPGELIIHEISITSQKLYASEGSLSLFQHTEKKSKFSI